MVVAVAGWLCHPLFGWQVASTGACRSLRLWLSNFSLFDISAFRWLVGVSAAVVGLYWLVTLGTYSPCFTQVLGEVHDLAGFDFEIRETDCWHNPAVSVFVAKAGHTAPFPIRTRRRSGPRHHPGWQEHRPDLALEHGGRTLPAGEVGTLED